MSGQLVLQEWEGQVCRLVLNRPTQGNALNKELVLALNEAFDDVQIRKADLILLEGAGKHFCTGFDLSNLDSESDDNLLLRFVRIELLLQRVARMPIATLAVAQGRVTGAGADLFVACRVRTACAGATFAFPGARGFGLALGSRRLAALVGAARAQDWIGSGREISLEEAELAGLVTAGAEPLRNSTILARDQAVLSSVCDPSPWARRAIDGNAEHDDSADIWALIQSAAQPGLRERVGHYVRSQTAARLSANSVRADRT